MEIKNDEDLEKAAQQAGKLLQGIQIYLRYNENDRGKVTFPTGFLWPVKCRRSKLSWIKDETLRTNVYYTRMLVGTLLWLLKRTTLKGIAASMVKKAVISLEASICEALTIQEGTEHLGRGSKYNKRVCALRDKYDVLNDKDVRDLEWLWASRSRIHLQDLKETEFGHYEKRDYQRAQRITERLISKMCQWSESSNP